MQAGFPKRGFLKLLISAVRSETQFYEPEYGLGLVLMSWDITSRLKIFNELITYVWRKNYIFLPCSAGMTI